MSPQHIDPAEAVRIFATLDPGRAIGTHWGTFRLTDESRDLPCLALAAALHAHGISPDRFIAAEPGTIIDR